MGRIGACACGVLLLLFATDLARGDFVVNGSFEDVQISDPFFVRSAAGLFTAPGSPTIPEVPGWTHVGAGGTAYIWAVGYADNPGDPNNNSILVAGDGKQFVTMGGGYQADAPAFAGWMQTLTGLTPNATYQLTFKMAAEESTQADSGDQTITVDFLSGSSTASQSFTSSPTVNYWRNWVSESMFFVADSSSVALQFSAVTVNDVGLDDVAVFEATPVPEPATFTLFVLAVPRPYEIAVLRCITVEPHYAKVVVNKATPSAGIVFCPDDWLIPIAPVDAGELVVQAE